MKVRDLLSREHAMFRRLFDALESDLPHPEPRARAEMSSALRTLLPSLDRHEELEDLIFEGHGPTSAPDGALDMVRAQHRAIGALRGEILYALELADKCPLERLRSLSRFLIMSLRLHLETEELQLWPHYARVLDEPADRDMTDPLHRRARVLEKQLRRGLASIAASFH
jgi:hypothetical protein